MSVSSITWFIFQRQNCSHMYRLKSLDGCPTGYDFLLSLGHFLLPFHMQVKYFLGKRPVVKRACASLRERKKEKLKKKSERHAKATVTPSRETLAKNWIPFLALFGGPSGKIVDENSLWNYLFVSSTYNFPYHSNVTERVVLDKFS